MNTQEFQIFYHENLSLIYRYVYNKVGNREEAEDLTSQVFLKAMRGIDFNRGSQGRRTWLFRVAYTTIADYWRVHYRAATKSLDALLDADWEGPTNEEIVLSSGESAERVQRILQALSQRDREVLTCRFLLKLSVRETAVRMGLTETNVKVMQYRALKRAATLSACTSRSS